MRTRYGILPHTAELPDISTSTYGVKRPGLLVRACPNIGHGDLANLLARAVTFEGNKAVVHFVRDIQDLSYAPRQPPTLQIYRISLCPFSTTDS